jgi:hypothetical protein
LSPQRQLKCKGHAVIAVRFRAHRPAGNAGRHEEIAGAVAAALALDPAASEALCVRRRQFAEFAFAAESVAAAIRGVYTSLLTREA